VWANTRAAPQIAIATGFIRSTAGDFATLRTGLFHGFPRPSWGLALDSVRTTAQYVVEPWSDSMPANIAQRRAKKTARRKAVLQDRRRSEMAGNRLPEGNRGVSRAPIQRCLVQQHLFENGMGVLVLARGLTPTRVTMATFLLDVYCLGIKNIIVRALEASELAYFITTMEETSPFVAMDPCDARKLLRDLALWAQSMGIAPHRDFAAAERLFGDVRLEASAATFQFGHDGKPLYVAGAYDSPVQIRRRLNDLRTRLGDDGFHYIVPV
jgi:hypothetical protein